jgi:hypothetical protein
VEGPLHHGVVIGTSLPSGIAAGTAAGGSQPPARVVLRLFFQEIRHDADVVDDLVPVGRKDSNGDAERRLVLGERRPVDLEDGVIVRQVKERLLMAVR